MARRLKSYNVDDYIENADGKAVKEQYGTFLTIIGALIGLGALIVVFAFISSNKPEEIPYSERTAAKKEIVEDTKVEKESESSNSGGFALDLDFAKDATQKETIDYSVLRMNTTPASAEVVSSPFLSGSFQIGDYLFTIPCSLSTFTDNGLKIVSIGGKELTEVTDESMTLSGSFKHDIILQYDDTSRFCFTTYDKEDVNVLDATVVIVSQDMTSDYYDKNTLPLFIPGGAHIGMNEDDAKAIFAGDPLYKANEFGYSIYNGPTDFVYKKNNRLEVMFDTKNHMVTKVDVFKTYIDEYE